MKKTNYARRGGTFKFRLPCDENIKTDKDWLTVQRYLTDTSFNILLGTVKNYKQVVIKFGDVAEMQNEYNMSLTANQHHVPNFVKFLCSFSCTDDISKIKTRNFNTHNSLCMDEGHPLGVIVMPYFSLGSLESYKWTRSNFHVLKNVVKQTVFALLYAYQKFNFIHRDMHTGNVLLRASKKKDIQYGDHHVPVEGIYAIIMDFGRSRLEPNAEYLVYQDIQRFISLVLVMDQSDLQLQADLSILKQYRESNQPITPDVYTSLSNIIDRIGIQYAKSERPKR